MKNLVLGIDVGGTNVKFGLVNAQGKIIARRYLPTKSYNRDKNSLIEAIFARIDELLLEHRLNPQNLVGIGIGLPGSVDPIKGFVIFLPNIPGWNKVPLKKIFGKKYKIPTYLGNDVSLITLGEWKYGAGRGRNNLICMTLGTGVGSGLILDGKLYQGEGFVAGELGHMPLNEKGPQCNCGGYGCFEKAVGNTQLLEKITKTFSDPSMTIPDVYRLARKGDVRALKFWEEAGTHIGNGLVGVVNLLNPPLIIIGGGVSNNHQFLFPHIRAVIKKRAMKVQGRMVKIVHSRLGDDAGILGARVLVTEAKK